MAERFQVRLIDEDPPRYGWQGGEGDAAALAAAAGRRPVVLIVPAEHVLITAVELPTRSRRELERAVPYALEERLAGELESLHFAYGSRRGGGAVPVAVVSHARMEGWIAPLRGAGIDLRSIVPDCLCLPWMEGTGSALVEEHRLLLRDGTASGEAMDFGALALLLPRKLAAGAAQALRLRFLPGIDPAPVQALLAGAGVTLIDTAPVEGPASLLQAADDPPIELLQGRYSPHAQATGWKRWRVAALLLLAALLVHVGFTLHRLAGLEAEAAALEARSEALFRESFPEVKRIVDMRVQADQQLEALRARATRGDPFLRLFLPSGEALAAIGPEPVVAASYGGGALELELQLGELALLERYLQDLRGRGLAAEIVSADSAPGTVRARVRIREGSAP